MRHRTARAMLGRCSGRVFGNCLKVEADFVLPLLISARITPSLGVGCCVEFETSLGFLNIKARYLDLCHVCSFRLPSRLRAKVSGAVLNAIRVIF